MPRLQQMMKDALPNSEINYSISTDHVVALGAALEASYCQTTPTTPPTSLSSTLPCTTNDILMTVSLQSTWKVNEYFRNNNDNNYRYFLISFLTVLIQQVLSW